jgi:hypothetical protein
MKFHFLPGLFFYTTPSLFMSRLNLRQTRLRAYISTFCVKNFEAAEAYSAL